MILRLASLIALCALVLGGCSQSKQIAQPISKSTKESAKEIAWFNGTVHQAIAAASKNHKPLLVFWGAKWCPYCQALRKTVFTRADFIEKTTLFIPVYLDGDLPGAQVWGETFKVSGYPTLLILTADRTELARLSGGMDLSHYATVLDEALEDQRPILDILQKVGSPAECHRLSYYGWDPTAIADMSDARLAKALANAAALCQGPDRTRLNLWALNLGLEARSDPAQLVQSVKELSVLLEHPQEIQPAFDLLVGLDDSIITLVKEQGATFADVFRTRWVQTMQVAADDERFGDADRLLALASSLGATQALTPDHTIPAPVRQAALDRIQRALGAEGDRYKRNDLVNAAGILYDELGEEDTARAMYLKELPNTHTPYYYMSHLAAIAEKQGRPQEALDWLSKAYVAAEGPSTHLRWGSAYLRALIRLAPNDSEAIRAVALQVATDASPDVVAGRSRGYIAQISKALDAWANTPQRRAVAAEVEARFPRGVLTQGKS
jgi:thiol-disulfide isomerase/thioredoxin